MDLPQITALTVGAAFLAGVLAAGAAPGQDYSVQPEMAELAERIEERPALFALRGGTEVDRDLIERGRLVAMGGSNRGGAAMACFTCHGIEGAGDGSGAFPRIAGMSAWYLYKQLADYAAGTRPNQVMSGIAQRLSEAEMEAVSAYYAAVEAPWPESPGPTDPLLLQWGGQLAAIGSAELGVPACVNCHGAMGSGLPPSVPYLAGQYGEYIALQLKLWKAGVRDNDAMNVMEAIASKMSEDDMRAVGAYYERVRPGSAAGADLEVELDFDIGRRPASVGPAEAIQ